MTQYQEMSNDDVDDLVRRVKELPREALRPYDDGCVGCGGCRVKLYLGRFVCDDCEALNGSYIDSLPEWRAMPTDGSKHMERCGVVGSDLYTASNLGCTMLATHAHHRRSVMLQSWSSMAPRDRALYGKMTDMSRKSLKGKIPVSVMYLAQRFYKTVNDLATAKGTRRAGLCEGAVYTAFKACGVSRSTREIANIFDTPVDVVERGCKRMATYIETPQQSCRPQHFAMRFASDLFKDEESLAYILPLIDAVEELTVLAESKPTTVAAACLAILGDRFGVARRDVARECNVAEATIAKCTRKLKPYVDDLFEVSGVPVQDVA
jgi:transcription initiation factor TFIIIB Brf1 subunit/transcription initiation factor TFIIB